MKNLLVLTIALVSSLIPVTTAPATAAPLVTSALEGTWVVDVSVDPALPIGDFVALETYSRSGGLVTTNNIARAAGIDVGQGAWERIAAHTYRASILFFVFAPDGSRAGAIEVSHTIKLTTRQTYVGEGLATLRGPGGAVVASATFTSSGRKMSASEF